MTLPSHGSLKLQLNCSDALPWPWESLLCSSLSLGGRNTPCVHSSSLAMPGMGRGTAYKHSLDEQASQGAQRTRCLSWRNALTCHAADQELRSFDSTQLLPLNCPDSLPPSVLNGRFKTISGFLLGCQSQWLAPTAGTRWEAFCSLVITNRTSFECPPAASGGSGESTFQHPLPSGRPQEWWLSDRWCWREGEKLAASSGAYYVETSAKSNGDIQHRL